MNASWALQQAVFAALGADADVKAALGDPPRIFDAVPRDAAFPFAVIGDDAQSDWSTKTEGGSEHRFAVRIWSRSGGRNEAKDIAEAIANVLDDAALSVSGFALISLRFLGANFSPITNDETFPASVNFRAVLEPT